MMMMILMLVVRERINIYVFQQVLVGVVCWGAKDGVPTTQTPHYINLLFNVGWSGPNYTRLSS